MVEASGVVVTAPWPAVRDGAALVVAAGVCVAFMRFLPKVAERFRGNDATFVRRMLREAGARDWRILSG
ncbi:hypothetical protein PGAAJM_01415 [Kocuria varians]